ncbi:MAG: hypothetical protein ACJAT2_002440 [Bacteriovoracaceae bacterium]|jgi:hypothetical protein
MTEQLGQLLNLSGSLGKTLVFLSSIIKKAKKNGSRSFR